MAPRKIGNVTLRKQLKARKLALNKSFRDLQKEDNLLKRTETSCLKKISKIRANVTKKEIKIDNLYKNVRTTEQQLQNIKASKMAKRKPKGLKTVPIEAVLFPPNAAVIPGIKYNKRGKPLTAAQIAFGERQRAKKGTGKPKYVRKTANNEELKELKRANLARGRAKRSVEAELNRIKKNI